MSEIDLARHVVNWLDGYDVYQEVEGAGGVCDIVVDVNGRGWVIETKTSFGLAVIAQAAERQRFGVTRVSVAVPGTSRSKSRWFATKICRDAGIGVIEVNSSGYVSQKEPPRYFRSRAGKLHRRHQRDILELCREEHRSYCEAGSNRGGHWTPFKGTIDCVRSYLLNNGPSNIGQIMGGIEHHYRSDSTAKASLHKWLDSAVVPEVEVDKTTKPFTYSLKESA